MSERALTAEQEAAIQEAIVAIWQGPSGPEWSGDECMAAIERVLRGLARRLLEPVEEEKAEFMTATMEIDTNLRVALEDVKKRIGWWEHADRYDTARLCVDAEGNPSLTLFGPGEPGTRPYFAVSIEDESDDGGAWGAFLRYGGRDVPPDVGEFKTFPELRSALLDAIEADRVARAALAKGETSQDRKGETNG